MSVQFFHGVADAAALYTENSMIKRVEWRNALWSRRPRGGVATSTPGGASVLSRERVRELEQPTYLRRNLAIEGLADASAWRAGERGASGRG
jgi:hypothetical protein